MMMAVSSGAAAFRENVVTTLAYWRERTRDLDDQAIIELDRERQNLFRAMKFGLALPQAWEYVAVIAVQAIPLVNRRMYRTEWLPILQQLLDQAPVGQEEWRIRLLVQYGRLQRMQRQLDHALEVHQEAQTLAEELSDTQLLALVTYNLGRDYLDKRQYAEAERHSLAAIDMLGETGNQKLLALAYDTLGHAARERGNLEESLDYLTKALEINRNSDDISMLGRSLASIANTLRASGRLDEAIEFYREARQVLAPTINELDKVLISLNLGGAYFEKGDWLLAELSLRQADLIYLQQSGNLHFQAMILVSLGNVLLKQKRMGESEAMLRRSVKLWQQVEDKLNLANALGSLGEVLAAQGSPEAEAYLSEALVLLAGYRDEPYAQRLRVLFQAERDKLARDKD